MTEPLPICEADGCNKPGIICALWDFEAENPAEITYIYCPTHAWEEGFCYGCGQFWAGLESFDFNPRHVCSNCDVQKELDDL